MSASARVFFVGGAISYRALFNWIQPGMYVATMLGSPLFQILFFTYLGRAASSIPMRSRLGPAFRCGWNLPMQKELLVGN